MIQSHLWCLEMKTKKRTKKFNKQLHLLNVGASLVKNFIVGSVVSQREIQEFEDRELVPKTIIYNTAGNLVTPTKAQAHILKELRMNWTVYTAVVCRDKRNGVYFDHEQELSLLGANDKLTLRQLNEYVANTLLDSFEKSSKDYRLTMLWACIPRPYSFKPHQEVAPLFYSKVLGSMQTQWEVNHPDVQVYSYETETLSKFVDYIQNQHNYILEISNLRKEHSHD